MRVIAANHHISLNDLLRERQEIDLVKEVLYREGVLKTLENHPADVLLLTCDLPGETDLFEICSNARMLDIRVVFLAGDMDENDPLLKKLVSVGVWDILFNPVNDKLIDVLFDNPKYSKVAHLGKGGSAKHKPKVKTRFNRHEEDYEGPMKPVITAVWSPVSTGKTFLSTMLAVMSAEQQKTVLVDLDTKERAVSTWLNLPPEIENIYSLIANIQISGYKHKLYKKLTVFYAGVDAEHKNVTPYPGWEEQLDAKVAIVDMPAELDNWHWEFIKKVDYLIIVTDPDLHHCLKIRQELGNMDFILVVNKDVDLQMPVEIGKLIKEPLARIPFRKKIYDDIAIGTPPVSDRDIKSKANIVLDKISKRKAGRKRKEESE